jgi:hypothetical protein
VEYPIAVLAPEQVVVRGDVATMTLSVRIYLDEDARLVVGVLVSRLEDES